MPQQHSTRDDELVDIDIDIDIDIIKLKAGWQAVDKVAHHFLFDMIETDLCEVDPGIDPGFPVQYVDFWGTSEQGQLTRIESLRPGMFWHVWAEYFRNSDISRVER